MPDLRVYGIATGQKSTFYFPFMDPNSSAGDYLQAEPTIEDTGTSDCRIMKDGGAWADTTNLAAWEGEGYGSIVLTGAEMTAQIIVVKIRDITGVQEWVTTSIIIHTGGHASALHSG